MLRDGAPSTSREGTIRSVRIRGFLYATLVGASLAPVAFLACGSNAGSPAPDAGGADVTAPPGDGGLDGQPETSSPGQDSASEGAPIEASPGTSYCSKLSPQPTFCSDFDEGPGSLSPWNLLTTNFIYGDPSGGTITLDTSTSTSPPASLHEVTEAMPDAGVYRALAQKVLGVTGSETTFAADVLLASADTEVFADLSFEHPDGNEDDLLFDLVYGQLYQSVPAGDSGTDGITEVASFGLDGGVPFASWHRISVDVVVGPPATVSVMIDSTPVLPTTPLDARFSNGSVGIVIGVEGRPMSGVQDLHVDNVVVDTKP